MDSIDNIHSRYRHNFALPSVYVISILAYSTSALTVIVVSLAGLISLASLFLSTSLVLFLFSVSITIEYYILKNNPLMRLKRLMFISLSSNILWLFVLTIGLVINFSSLTPWKFTSILVLGIFVAASLRLFVFKTLFIDALYKALPLASIQPALIGLVALYSSSVTYLVQEPRIYVGGAIIIVSAVVFMVVLDVRGRVFFGEKTLKIMQAFLYAWLAHQPDKFEKIVSKTSSKVEVGTSILSFGGVAPRPALIATDVHPGPFHPVGSSNLPYLMHQWFVKRGYSPIILHGMSGHELDLPSKEEVQNFLESLNSVRSIASTDVCTLPATQTVGKSTVMGIAFNDVVLLTITLSPHGTDDFPKEVGDKIRELTSTVGFKHAIVIDSHNSQGSRPDATDYEDVCMAAQLVLRQLRASVQHPFKVGSSHSSEFSFPFGGDIGPAGVGVLILEVSGRVVAIIGVDSNNARLGLREAIIASLADSGVSVAELYTTDTHVTVGGRGTGLKGYYALGELTNENTLIDSIHAVTNRAIDRLTDSTLAFSVSSSEVQVMGMGALDNISLGLDKSLSFAKKGALVLFFIFLMTIVFMSFF